MEVKLITLTKQFNKETKSTLVEPEIFYLGFSKLDLHNFSFSLDLHVEEKSSLMGSLYLLYSVIVEITFLYFAVTFNFEINKKRENILKIYFVT